MHWIKGNAWLWFWFSNRGLESPKNGSFSFFQWFQKTRCSTSHWLPHISSGESGRLISSSKDTKTTTFLIQEPQKCILTYKKATMGSFEGSRRVSPTKELSWDSLDSEYVTCGGWQKITRSKKEKVHKQKQRDNKKWRKRRRRKTQKRRRGVSPQYQW